MPELSWAFLILQPSDFSFMIFYASVLMHKKSKWRPWIRKVFSLPRVADCSDFSEVCTASLHFSSAVEVRSLVTKPWCPLERQAGKSEAVRTSEYILVGHLVVTHNKEFKATEILFGRRLKIRHHGRDTRLTFRNGGMHGMSRGPLHKGELWS